LKARSIVEHSFRVLLSDAHATEKFGAALAATIEDRAVIALIGPMGAGKTTLVKAVAAGLGVREIVNSPTFTMLNEYHSGRLPLYHMDLYRLSEEQTPAPLGLLVAEIEEFIETPMVAMFEWAELLPGLSDAESPNYLSTFDHLTINLEYCSNASGAQSGEPMMLNGSESTEALNDSDASDARLVIVSASGKDSANLAQRLISSFAAV
jgi:tRNA threonylcarbamoyladenosine biosynthesis protein TsaE